MRRNTAESYLLLNLLLMSILPASVHGLGIGPVQVFKVYEPGSQKIELIILDGGNITLAARGDLADYIFFEEDTIIARDGQKITYALDMPADLEPGLHDTDIIVTENRKDEPGIISAVVSYKSLLRVLVPYDHAEAKLVVNPGESDAEFAVYIHNLAPLARTFNTTVLVADQAILFSPINIPSIEEMSQKKTISLEPGRYKADAAIAFSGGIIELSEEFIVGKKYIDIENIEFEEPIPGEVSEFILTLRNHWPEALETSVLLEIGNHSYESELVKIEETASIRVYWPATVGNHTGKVTLLYNGIESSREFEISAEEVTYHAIPWLTIAIILFLLMILHWSGVVKKYLK